MTKRYIVEATWSVLESARHEIEAASADDALTKLLRAEEDDPRFYDVVETWSDTTGTNSYEVRDRNGKVLRSIPTEQERRIGLNGELVSALKELSPLASKRDQKRFARLVRAAESACADI